MGDRGCGRLLGDPDDPHSVINPVAIVEVLSDSTEAYDRGEKFAHYRRISSLQEYILISQHTQRVESYFRPSPAVSFTLTDAGPGQTLTLRSLDCVLNIDALYLDPLLPE